MDIEEFERLIPDFLTVRCTPERITSLTESEVVVFGTDPEGEHTSDAARLAVKEFGARQGKGEGLHGQSYAIPVHTDRKGKMVKAVWAFIDFAKAHPKNRFFVLDIGCDTFGMDAAFVALMFRKAIEVVNICLPKIFVEELIRYYEIGVKISEDCMTVEKFPMGWSGNYAIPNGVVCIDKEAFMGCSCKLELPESLSMILEGAFYDMASNWLKIPKSVWFIGKEAFCGDYGGPSILVYYESYAYHYAKKHRVQYKCIDFDEETYLREKRDREEASNQKNHGLLKFITGLGDNGLCQRRGHSVNKGQIAICFGFAAVLNDDGHITLVGYNSQFKQLPSDEKIVKIAATRSGYMGLTEGGRILTGQLDEEGFQKVKHWSHVKELVGCEGHVLAVLQDGTVACADGSGDWAIKPKHEQVVKDWRNVRQVAAGFSNVMALTEDGRVLYHCMGANANQHFYDGFSDIVQIDCFSVFYGTESSMVLHEDGTVSSDTFEGVDTWRDIIQISVGDRLAIGLRRDGRIEMADKNKTRLEAKKWTDLVYVECKFHWVVGITKDGRILSLCGR